MEVIHDIIKESVSGGFFKFCGYWIMTAVIVLPITALANALFRPIKKLYKD
tara:strand:+ start:692 stop:844 length:153 start_codon:yes stop_codon:yes gene_type:complete